MSSENPACDELRSKVPLDWDVQPLDAVTDFQEGPGILAKDFRDSGVPLLRLRNIETPIVQLGGCNFLDAAKVALKWQHFGLKEGDLLISTSASLGRVSVVGPLSVGSIAYTGIIRFRSRSEGLHHQYLRAFLSSGVFVEQAERMATGSVIRHFGPSHLRQMAITLPPLNEQVQIAEIYDALDDRITLLRETNATLEAIAQALFKSWFVDFDPVRAKMEGRIPEGMDEATAALFPDGLEDSELGLVPQGWRADSVYAVSSVIYGAPFASKLFNSNQDGAPLIRIRDLRDEAPGVFTPEVHPKGYMVQPGDIVVGMDGEFRAYLWGGERAWLNQRVCVFAPRTGCPAAFVHRAIMPLLAAVEASETATTVIHLGKNDIDRFKILVPDDRVLMLFGMLTDGLYSKIVNNKQSARTLATLRDTLLPRLISGQLRLPEAEQTVEEEIA